ncbi:MAG: hypothetical protein HQK54_09490 [Oligoflexales bacterium]|nr:hypothetical protein [Oligoflexales bacterium]
MKNIKFAVRQPNIFNFIKLMIFTGVFMVCCTLQYGCEERTRKDDKNSGELASEPVADDSRILLKDHVLTSEVALSMLHEAISTAAIDIDRPKSKESPDSFEAPNVQTCDFNFGEPKEYMRRVTSITQKFERKLETIDLKLGIDEKRDRIWKKTGENLVCDSNKQRVDLSKVGVARLNLEENFTRAKSMTLTRRAVSSSTSSLPASSLAASSTSSSPAAEPQTLFERNYLSVGKWNLEWMSEKIVDQDLTRTRSAIINTVMENVLPDANQKHKKIKLNIKAVDGNPVIIEDTRNSTNLINWLTRSLNSGTLSSVQNDGTRVELKFIFVKFSATDPCLFISGEVKGSLFESKDAGTATDTFTITFKNQKGIVQFASGKTYDFVGGGCDLESQIQKDL